MRDARTAAAVNHPTTSSASASAASSSAASSSASASMRWATTTARSAWHSDRRPVAMWRNWRRVSTVCCRRPTRWRSSAIAAPVWARWNGGLWHHYAVIYDSENGTRIYKDDKIYATPRSSGGGSLTGALPSSVQAPVIFGADESNAYGITAVGFLPAVFHWWRTHTHGARLRHRCWSTARPPACHGLLQTDVFHRVLLRSC